jgi:glc operon protein GlcG
MTMRIVLAALLCASPFAAVAAPALPAQSAWQVIEGCVAQARSKGHGHAIAVYDDTAHPVAMMRMDGSQPGVVEFAMEKAVAVATWHFSTADMENAAKGTPGFARAPHVVTVPGGIPLYSADGAQFIGAVGVSGGDPKDDAACAEAGVKAAGLSLSRKKNQ